MKKSFPFEYEAWIAGTAFLNRREKGAYMDLLCVQAGKGHLTLQEIKDILNGDIDCWDKLKSKFTEENGLYYNRKLESVKQGKQKKTIEEIAVDRAKMDEILKEKRQKFYEDCKPYLAKYPKEMLRAFYNYWTEMNKSQTRLKFELQQTFEIGKRLATWANRDTVTNKNLSRDNISYKELLFRFNKGEIDIWEKYEAITPGDKHSLWKFKNQTNET
jgi:hypothetical protein